MHTSPYAPRGGNIYPDHKLIPLLLEPKNSPKKENIRKLKKQSSLPPLEINPLSSPLLESIEFGSSQLPLDKTSISSTP